MRSQPAPPKRPITVSERNVRAACGERLKILRKQKDLTQKEVAAQLGVHATQFNKYEMGLHAPPPDKLVFLAEFFGVTVDHLLTGDTTDTRPLHHLRLLERFRVAQEFPDDDQEALIRIIDAMIAQYRTRSAIASLDRPKKKSEKNQPLLTRAKKTPNRNGWGVGGGIR